jgi:hypothetical protein
MIERRTLADLALDPEDSTIKMRASSGCSAKYKMNVSTATLIREMVSPRALATR